MIFLIGAGLAFFLVILLIGKKDKSSADKILTLWIFITAVNFLTFYFDKSELFFEIFLIIHGPFLLIYMWTHH